MNLKKIIRGGQMAVFFYRCVYSENKKVKFQNALYFSDFFGIEFDGVHES